MSQIFFAWADGSEKAFDPVAHAREDEDIFSLTLTHEEGQIPILDIVLRYPEIDGVALGLLHTSRKQWCWLSWRNADDVIEPLFFGRLIGFPQNVNDILVPLRFHSRAPDFVAQKQALADTLRVRPFYDPIFFDDKSMEDPEAILEGWSASFHVDRKTLKWSISDILVGEDGTVTFDEGDIIDGTIEVHAKEAPLRAVRVDATVHWKQYYRNTLICVTPREKRMSYSPQGLADAWPKIGASLGGGWIVAPGTFAVAHGGADMGTHEESGSWQDENPHHNDGDAISCEWNVSAPLGGSVIEQHETATYGSIGGGVDFLNTPPGEISTGEQPSSTSSSYSRTWRVIYSGTVESALWIKPDGSPNNFTESLTLTVRADMQGLLSDPTSQEETEVISLQGQNVGEAVIDFKCLTTLSGQAVQAGQILYPNIFPPDNPSEQTYQIALNDGVCGVAMVEEEAPAFSDVAGEVVAWGGVDFACIGSSLPSIIDWQPEMWVKVGTILCVESMGGWFFLCDQGGFTGKYSPFEMATTNPFLPVGTVQPVPGIENRGARISDGGVVWTALGAGGPSLHVPAQGQPGNIVANSFFDRDRGAACAEYMIMVARNKIRTRARAIEIKFRTTWDAAVDLSCRKNASVHAPKVIPGGWATGKVTAYTLSWSGMDGRIYADVTIGCSIGAGTGDAARAPGTPTVAGLDALDASAQHMAGASVVLGPEISYQPPPPDQTYNGFRFPLTREQVVMVSGWNSTALHQLQSFMEQMARPGAAIGFMGLKGAAQRAQLAAVIGLKQYQDPYYYEFWLRPISDQHTETPYVVKVSKLNVPKQINLEA